MWTGNCITYVEAAVLATDGTLGEAPPPDPCLGELLLWRGGGTQVAEGPFLAKHLEYSQLVSTSLT